MGTFLTGGTDWSTMYTTFSTTPGWRATIIDDLTNPPVSGAKRLRLEVYVGRTTRKTNTTALSITYSGAPEFIDTPNWSFGSWTTGSGTGTQLNAASEASITAWANGSFSYVPWENGTTGSYKIGMIFTFEGFTTYGSGSGYSITYIDQYSDVVGINLSSTYSTEFITSAEAGDTVYVWTDDYEEGCTVTASGIGTVTTTYTSPSLGTGCYSFTMPAANVTIAVA